MSWDTSPWNWAFLRFTDFKRGKNNFSSPIPSMQCCATVRATHRKQQTPTLNGEDREGVWILLFSEITLINFSTLSIAGLWAINLLHTDSTGMLAIGGIYDLNHSKYTNLICLRPSSPEHLQCPLQDTRWATRFLLFHSPWAVSCVPARNTRKIAAAEPSYSPGQVLFPVLNTLP